MTSEAADVVNARETTTATAPGDPAVRYEFGLIVPDKAVIQTQWTYVPPAAGEPPKWRGPCAMCTHDHLVEVPDRVVNGVVPQADEPVSVQVRMFPCLCPLVHEGRPEGVLGGCGRYWLGRVEHRGGRRYTLAVETDLALLPQARALDEAARSESLRARTMAEKWVGGVTALLGLLSVSSVITGATASKAVRSDLRWLVFAVAVLAIGTAAVALVFAYRAAFGAPGTASVRTQTEQNRWWRKVRLAGPRAVRQLKVSFALTLVSLLLAVVVAVLLWFLPQQKSPAQCTVQGQGSCQVP